MSNLSSVTKLSTSSKIGRRIKLTGEAIGGICEYIKEGSTVAHACMASGISRRTYYYWIERGEQVEEKEANEEILTEEEGLFLQFIQAIRKAEAECQIKLVREISNDKNWQSKAWLLERRFPEDWARKDRMQLEQDKPMQHIIEIREIRREDLERNS